MKIPLWIFLADTDAGTQPDAFTDPRKAYESLYNAAFGDVDRRDSEDYAVKLRAQIALDAGDFDDLADIVSTFQEGSCDFYSVHEDEIEVPSPFRAGELVTILHALRCYQETLTGEKHCLLGAGCDHFAEEKALLASEVGDLCERLTLNDKGRLEVQPEEKHQ